MGSEKQVSVVLHMEDFEDVSELKDAEAGKLLKAILDYVSTGVLPDRLGVQTKIMFNYIRRHIDRDKSKYDETCRKRAEAGRQGGRPKKGDSENQNKAKKVNGFSEKQKNPDTDTEPDTDTDTEPDTDTDTEPDTDTEAPRVCAGAAGAEVSGEEREKRIRILETYEKLYKSGIIDEESHRRYSAELNRLKGG